jgi:serine/threonine protein kinase
LVDEDEHGHPYAVLTDFGITQIVSSKTLLVKQFHVANVRAASLRYAAPEAMTNRKTTTLITPATDIFSMACTIYHAITAKIPWV